MRKFTLFLLHAMVLAGCTGEIESIQPTGGKDSEEMIEIPSRSLEGAVYNEVVDTWMVPQADPYTLANFQEALDNLASGNTTQALTRAQAMEFSAVTDLKPTHYALKIYPRNEDEQWQVERMEDVRVAYIPFDYSQLTVEEVEKVEKTRTRSEATSFTEKSPYTVASVECMASNGHLVDSDTFQLPILYVVWPINKPLPKDLEFVVDYEVFLPHECSETLSSDVMSFLETEAVSTALGVRPSYLTRASTGTTVTAKLNVYTYDNTVGHNVSMDYLKVRYQSGSYISEPAERNYGNGFDGWYEFQIQSPYLPATITFTYQIVNSPYEWKIVREGSTVPHSISLRGSLLPVNSAVNIALPTDNYQINEIYRAANDSFRRQPMAPGFITDGAKIVAHNGRDTQYGSNGYFLTLTEDIHIFNNGRSHGNTIGTTTHEIAHFIHYKNTSSIFDKTPTILRESLASCVGWYMALQYYAPYYNYNFVSVPDMTGQARQHWYRTFISEYSPLFVDLIDSLNQSTVDPNCPNDEIKGVPISVVWDVASTCWTWAQYRAKLKSYVGTYYTAKEFDNWIADFDVWVNRNIDLF